MSPTTVTIDGIYTALYIICIKKAITKDFAHPGIHEGRLSAAVVEQRLPTSTKDSSCAFSPPYEYRLDSPNDRNCRFYLSRERCYCLLGPIISCGRFRTWGRCQLWWNYERDTRLNNNIKQIIEEIMALGKDCRTEQEVHPLSRWFVFATPRGSCGCKSRPLRVVVPF